MGAMAPGRQSYDEPSAERAGLGEQGAAAGLAFAVGVEVVGGELDVGEQGAQGGAGEVAAVGDQISTNSNTTNTPQWPLPWLGR